MPLLSNANSPTTYDQIIPYYAEYCSVSSIVPLDGRGPGGQFGHSALYIKGVCRDTGANYPRVKVCPENININDPEAGVGVSVDNMFRNVVWMAVDGKNDFYNGSLPRGTRLDQNQHRATEMALAQKGYFKGIRLNEDYEKNRPANMPYEQYVAHMAIGTDVALTFGRNVYCTRLPLKKEMLPKMVNYLNMRNDELVLTGRAYQWNQFFDNCAHLAYGALAAAGLVPEKTTQPAIDVYTSQPVNDGSPKTSPFAMPGRVFAQLIELGNNSSLDVMDIYKNKLARDAFLQYKWVAAQPGSLFVYTPIRPASENSVYKDVPINKDLWAFGKASTLDRIENDPAFQNFAMNLNSFRQKYQAAWQNYVNFGNSLLGRLSLRTNSELRDFYQAYGQYLKAQQQWIDQNQAAAATVP